MKKSFLVIGIFILGILSGGFAPEARAETSIPADCWNQVNTDNYFNFEFILKFDASQGSKEDVLGLLMALSDLHRTVLTPEETVLCPGTGPVMSHKDPTAIYVYFKLCGRVDGRETLDSLESKANRDIRKFVTLPGATSLSCFLNQRGGGVTGSN